LNNSARTDLASESGKATLQAEADQTSTPLESSPESLAQKANVPGKVALAGGEVPQTDSPILQTGGNDDVAKKSSFWKFWSPKASPSGVKDPFADQPEPEKRTATPTQNEGVSGKAQLNSTSFSTSPSGAPGTDPFAKDPQAAELWFEKEFAKSSGNSSGSQSARRSLGSNVDETSLNPSSADFPWTTAKEPKAGRSSMPEWSPVAQEQDSFQAAPSTVGRATAPPSTAATIAEGQYDLRQSMSGTKSPATVTATDVRQQKLRVQALLSEAHTSAQRGEFHAAYRSTLLAEQIVNEYELTFGPKEEDPRNYARVLAAKIWTTSNHSEEAYIAATETASALPPARSLKPTAQKAPASSSASGATSSKDLSSPFQSDSFATWEPLPEATAPAVANQSLNVATIPSRSTETLSSTTQPAATANVLPEIRPWPNERAIRDAQPPMEFSNFNAPSTASTTPPLMTQNPEPQPLQIVPDSKSGNGSGVEFAIAQSLSNEQTPALLDPFGATPPVETHGSRREPVADRQSQSLANSEASSHRPLLMAPPTPEETGRATAQTPNLTWDDLSQAKRTESEKPANQASSRRVTWSIIGLICAGIATVLGLRMSRKEDAPKLAAASAPTPVPAPLPVQAEAIEISEAPQTLEIGSRENAAGDEVEAQPLRFKRAA